MATFAGCGYHRPGVIDSSRVMGMGGLHVSVFANKSYRAGLETIVTQFVIDEFARRSGGNLVDEAAADLTLNGAVLSYDVAPVAYTAVDRVGAYRATIKLLATLSERQTGKVLWKGELTESQDYPANVDLALQHNNEAAAITEICRRLAEQMHEKMQEDF